MPHKFRDLIVWQRSMEMVTDVYRLSARFPSNEQFGLTSQLRRAAVSIPLNIAEGSGSDSPNEFKRFLDIALKSTYETMTAVEIGQRLGYLKQQECADLLSQTDHIAAMIVGLTNHQRSLPGYKAMREDPPEYTTTLEADVDD
ncbi:MAG: four helix bundle protein [Anaerolineae bacterium]|nr:four helix bundle protein [Anaerolineae bacterium]